MPKKLTTEEFIQKAKLVHGDKYDYSLVEYINSTTKVKIICPIHGTFYQSPNAHLRGSSCKLCGFEYTTKSRKHTNESFINLANKKHNNKYDYSLVDYKQNKIKICIICPIHGKFYQSPNSHLQSYGCPTCGNLNSGPKLTTEEFIQKAKLVHGNKYDYSLVDYKLNKIK